MSIILITIMVFGIGNSTALPEGKGVQKYNPGVGWNDFAFIKGASIHAVFDFGDLNIKAGTWLSIIYGVTTGILPADTPETDEELVQGLYDFVFEDTEWYNTFDGVDITDGIKNAALDHEPYIDYFEDADGNQLKEIFFRAAFYIVPQSIGCYEYYGYAMLEDGFVLEVTSNICWLPGNMI